MKSPVLLISIGLFAFSIVLNSCKKDEESAEITDSDGNVYNSLTIGSQVWMVENLKTTKYNDGTEIPLKTANTEWINSTAGAYCYYNNDESANKDKYGALYNWHAVSSGKLCPVGWHVATDMDWTELIALFGGEDVAGGKLKATGTVEGGDGLWQSPNLDATNASGFSAIPGGVRLNGEFMDYIEWGFWWTSSEFSATHAWVRDIGSEFIEVARYTAAKANGLSVRCIKD